MKKKYRIVCIASTIKLVDCCIFYMEKVNEDASLDFKWLVKKGVGGKKKEVQFYASFMYDGMEYMLYDCVYMYKEGLREPYIGKITKIWENGDKTKKVKIHWFFRPEEISKWLGDTNTLENEILFASGEGVGLANISPLEAIAGKCNVVCISKDKRNPQPSNDELNAADFVFYRTFDVESCTISDNMGHEKIGGIEIEHIFNTRRENESINTLPQTLPTNNLKDDKQDSREKDLPNLADETAKSEKTISKIDEKDDKNKKEVVSTDKTEATKRKKNTSTESDNLHDQPLKKPKLDDKNPPKEKQVKVAADRDSEKLNDMASKKSIKASMPPGKNSDGSTSKADKDNSKLSKDKNETKASKVSAGKERMKSPPPPNAKQVEVSGETEKMTDLPSKKSKVDSKIKERMKSPPPPNAKQVEVSGETEKMTDLPSTKSKVDSKIKERMKSPPPPNAKQVEVSGETEKMTDLPSKKSKVDSKIKERMKSPPPPNAKQVEVGGEIEKMTDLPSKKSKVDSKIKDEALSTQEERLKVKNDKGDEMEKEGGILKKTKAEGSFKIPDNKKNKNSSVININGKPKSGVDVGPVVGSSNKENKCSEGKKKLSMSKSPKDMYREFVVGPKPNADRNGWFKRPPWDESLKNAHDQGTAILLHNIDPDYTSQDVENLIWHAFNEHSEAKILPHSAISNPHYYQALVLLKTKDAAHRVLAKLDEECLMLSNGRPLVGTPCPPIIQRMNCKFFGHLAIDRIKVTQREDEAVSTSHFSQPNTIEYDMAMEWFLLRSKSTKWWEKINALQGEELKELETKLVKK
ncbi:hypothetical protein LXL04_005683 [Taraxacum kok-saghyz]